MNESKEQKSDEESSEPFVEAAHSSRGEVLMTDDGDGNNTTGGVDSERAAASSAADEPSTTTTPVVAMEAAVQSLQPREETLSGGGERDARAEGEAAGAPTANRATALGWRRRLVGDGKKDPSKVATKLSRRLHVASEALLDRLFSYLSTLPEEDATADDVDFRDASQRRHQPLVLSSAVTGLTLPASAVGWLASHYFCEDSSLRLRRGGEGDVVRRRNAHNSCTNSSSQLSAPVRHRISLLKFLLPRLTHVRITADPWPPKQKKIRRRGRRRRGDRGSGDIFESDDDDAIPAGVLERGSRDEGAAGGTATSDDNRLSTDQERFLEYYDVLVHCPRVDLRIFPNCRVLLVDQVPPDWICNLSSLRHCLQVLRIERSCIFDLNELFGPPATSSPGVRKGSLLDEHYEHDDRSVEDPLLPQPVGNYDDETSMGQVPYIGGFRKLQYLKISSCNLYESSGFGGGKSISSPLSRMLHLKSVNLANNNIAKQKSVLSCLANKPFLSKLDLTNNRLVSLRYAHYKLGNIQTLLLSHNRLRTVEGIDRLYALETLWLDHNRISDLAHIRGLARLPELRSLRLAGNPFVERRPKAYRVEVFDLLRERRMDSLPRKATFRQFQNILPILDDKLATIGEMKALRERIFLRSVVVPSSALFREEEESGFVIVDVQQEGGEGNSSAENDPLAPPPSMGISPAGRISGRKPLRRKRRRVQIGRSGEDVKLVMVDARNRALPDSSHIRPPITFTVVDVLESISDKVYPSDYEDDQQEREQREKELEDEVKSEDQLESEGTEDAATGSGKETPSALKDDEMLLDRHSPPVDEEVECVSPSTGDSSSPDLQSADDELKISEVSNDQQPTAEVPPGVNGARHKPPIFPSPIATKGQSDHENEDGLPSAPRDDSRIERAFDISGLSPIQQVDEGKEMKSSSATATTAGETHGELQPEPSTPLAATARAEEVDEASESAVNDGDQSRSSEATPSFPPPLQGTDGPQPYLRVVTYPESLWQDDSHSGRSSIGTPAPAEESPHPNYHDAETKSTFEGASTYKTLRILENLDLYFRIFVFQYRTPDSTPVPSGFPIGIEDNIRQSIEENHPKIQLWPIDRRLREAHQEKAQMEGKMQPREEFRRVWTESVVACGKPALRRLTPNRGPRYGFHGELLWSAASTSRIRPEAVAECRKAIMCLSNNALYLILDNDAVAAKYNDKKLKFPLPIPQDATFEDAKWPHALARHPMETLRSITIGFGFQRLTLRFTNSTFPHPDDFTYVLLTANKMETVELLKELQTLAGEARTGIKSLPQHDAVAIDNDDRHVLDALGVAVAPDIIEVILHYQILRQRWKHGDRGSVRRVCVVTDTKLFLLDEDYVGDGSESVEAGTRVLAETMYRLVDSADLRLIDAVRAADADPNAITITIRPSSRLQRKRNWRLICRDRLGAEHLVEDVRKAMGLVA